MKAEVKAAQQSRGVLQGRVGETQRRKSPLKGVKMEFSDDEFDKHYKEMSNGMGFNDPISILANHHPSSMSLNNESTFSLPNTISTRSISTSGTGPLANMESNAERDIMNTFIDLDRLIDSDDDGSTTAVPQTPTFDAQFDISSLSSPSLTTNWDLSEAQPSTLNPTRVKKRTSIPHLRTSKSHLQLKASGKTPSSNITIESMATQAAKAAASSIPKCCPIVKDESILAEISAAQAMYPLKVPSPQKRRSITKLRQKRNQTFQHWMTTFQKEEPKPLAAPQVYNQIDDGLMNFQVEVKTKKRREVLPELTPE